MQRREFVKFCAASATAARVPAVAAADATPTFYGRVKLIAGNGAPLKAAAVPAERNLIFHYPFAATPCFLLNLGHPAKTSARLATADKRAYEWKGGVGPRRSIVAYSAICAHQLAYPTREISFISYRAEKTPTEYLLPFLLKASRNPFHRRQRLRHPRPPLALAKGSVSKEESE